MLQMMIFELCNLMRFLILMIVDNFEKIKIQELLKKFKYLKIQLAADRTQIKIETHGFDEETFISKHRLTN